MFKKLSGLFAVLALFGACASGDPVLKARSAAADAVVLSGETFLLVGDAFNTLCPAKKLPVQTCRDFRLFAEGADGKGGFKAEYPNLAKAYQDNKEVSTVVAQQAADAIARLAGFTRAANAAKGVK